MFTQNYLSLCIRHALMAWGRTESQPQKMEEVIDDNA